MNPRGLVAVALLLAGVAQAARGAPLEVRVSDEGGAPLAGAVLFLESQPGTGSAREPVRPLAGVEIEQVDRQFQPAVSVVTVGTAVTFPNRDTVRHHVYSFSPAKRFEIKLYVGTPSAPVVFDQPGIALIGCNIHDQMAGWIVIVDTPWHGRSDTQGRFTLPQVPPGAYKLRAWHLRMPVGEPPAEQHLRIDGGSAPVQARIALTGLAAS